MVIDSKLHQRIGKDVLGTTLYNYRDGYTVTGICEELQTNAYNRSKGIIFVPFYSEGNFGHCYLKCGQDGEERAKAYVEDVLRRSFPREYCPPVYKRSWTTSARSRHWSSNFGALFCSWLS